MYSTIRIVTENDSDGTGSVGTSFVFTVPVPPHGTMGFLVTNNHVVEGAKVGYLSFHTTDEHDTPTQECFNLAVQSFQDLWVPHPNPDVDLCATPIAPFIDAFKIPHRKLFTTSFSPQNIIPDENMVGLEAIEEVVMVGYPTGLWDEQNNFPLFRRGITATHPAVDYCGESVFLIDAAVFPGSSGSPVFILNKGIHKTATGLAYATAFFFLGVVNAVFLHHDFLTMGFQNIPTSLPTAQQFSIGANIGRVIKAREILTLVQHVANQYRHSPLPPFQFDIMK